MAKFSTTNTVSGTSDKLCFSGVLNHTTRYELTLLEFDESEIEIDSTNVVQIKIGQDGREPVLDINSYIDTPNGSSLTNTNPIVLTLDQDDMTFPPGVYDMEIIVSDDITGNPATHISHGIFVMQNTQLGETAI